MQLLSQCKDKQRTCFAVCITSEFNKEKFICIPTLIVCYTEFRVESLAQKGLKASSSVLVFQRNVAVFKFKEISFVFSVSYHFTFTSITQIYS